MNQLELIQADPASHIYAVIDAMIPYGVEAPLDDEGEIDEEAFAGLILTAANDILDAMEGDYLRVYRAIVVQPDWEPESLGVHWARRAAKAVAYNGRGSGTTIILEGLVHVDQVRLYPSIVLNMDLTEEEILLSDDAEIEILSAHTTDGQPSHVHLQDRRFHARFSPGAHFLS
ncbi:hypothetical protein G6L37_06450 [Agrobacterium rubi]|nr:hypothetical protein [Agrobacterium rubi]NTF25003.1 hypothetical protein [Agrobacterium rubi]